ncbi:MAG: DUF4382 domain-containing protein [Bacteroidales bacterium]|nr:DUF4382 domain-containing protein [Bacteroidales bacterium]MDD4712630.1 DUF4382 domain-containing protein [Bacteroidales bacterium]
MKRFFIGVALLGILSACDNNSENKATVSFSLTDAPSLQGYQALNVDVQGIEYAVDSGEFVSLPITPAIVNLMDLTNGKDTLLGNVELEAGQRVSQVRLILGDNNTLVLADGTEKNIKTPSAQTSGLKINIQSDVNATSGYKVMIDFDAEKSVVAKGNGTYSLKPVLRGYIVANTSKIFGYISPSKIPYRVMAIKGTDTIQTVSDTLLNNYFMLHGLISGTYDFKFLNSRDSVCKTLTQEVHGGTNVDLGTVEIAQ